ncbi:MAG: DJ-1/PfpI family protein [Candidatus Heimdallarchaeota archaeon]|nr:DJ-1/PfpI family protein [Candidatus Heimdallarchaeota archaeon]
MIHLFLYNDFADFEISQLLLLMRDQPLITVGFSKGLVKSVGNLHVQADISIEELKPEEVEIFIIPGGEPKEFIKNNEYSIGIAILNTKLKGMQVKNCIMGAICGGPTFLANAGILDGKKCTATISEDEKMYYKRTLFSDNDLEIDNNVITAKGQAFTEFAVNIARKSGILKTEKDMIDTINWFRNVKN